MKRNLFWLLLLILGSFLLLQGCGGGGDTPPAPAATPTPIAITGTEKINSDISQTTTWNPSKVYVIETGIYVSASLTIPPGTIVKFMPDTFIATSDTGSIHATGNSYFHIIFTSFFDDTRGGDTDNDSGATLPAKGNWNNIAIWTGGNTFNYCEFYYGGKSGYEYEAMLDVNTGGAASITNCTFAHSANAGLNIVGSIPSTTTVSSNTFFDNTKPLWINQNNNLNDTNVFHDPANPTQGNDCNGIWLEASAAVSTATNWGETEVPFILVNGLSVEAPLTLQPGVIIKLWPGTSIGVSGTISAIGNSTKHITFTSYADDSKGGDTDESGAGPNKGDWYDLLIETNGSNFTYCDFYYGGRGSDEYSAMMRFPASGAIVTINYCTFAHSLNAGLDLQAATPGSQVTNNAIYDCTIPLWMSPDFSIDGSNVFHNPAAPSQKNTQNGIWLQASQSVRANRNWGVTEVPYVATFQGFGIDVGKTLWIATGAVVKFDNPSSGIDIGLGASISNFSNVIFTSLNDDVIAHGGDTNGDGGLVSPANGDWEGIFDDNYAPNSHYRQDGNIYYDAY